MTLTKKIGLVAALLLSASFGANAALIQESCSLPSGATQSCVFDTESSLEWYTVRGDDGFRAQPQDLDFFFGTSEPLSVSTVSNQVFALTFLQQYFGVLLSSAPTLAVENYGVTVEGLSIEYDIKYSTSGSVNRALFDVISGGLDFINIFTHEGGDNYTMLNLAWTPGDVEVHILNDIVIGASPFTRDTNGFSRDDYITDNPTYLTYRERSVTTDVPEPASLALFGLAFAGLIATRRKKVALK